jgi:stage II sporulation protein P
LTHLKGKAGGVTIVAREIKKVIEEQYGIAVTYSPTIHDMAFNKSYAESEKTVRKLVKDNPKLEMLFDIHRDASLTREQSITKINGRTVAKILIVVGTDARTEHPKWRKNLEFARKIAAKTDNMYPGLSRGIAIKQGRYNQHLNPHALLIEIGSAKNTTDEAVASSRLFANVVVVVLNDMRCSTQSS